MENLPRTLTEFLEWEPTNRYKYEWFDGELIRFTSVEHKHLKLISKLNRLFITTKGHAQGDGLFGKIGFMLTVTQFRKADLAYFTNEQIESEEEVIPRFCIEIISWDDTAYDVKAKTIEYLKHGVEVVWLLFPELGTIEIHTSSQLVKICKNEDQALAYPLLNDFEITPIELFNQ